MDEEDDDDAENLNPDLIGANKALIEGDHDLYNKFMAGAKNYGIEQLIQDEGESEQLTAGDSEINNELKFDDTAYKNTPEQLAESITLDNMVKFDKTFKMVMEHVRKMMNISYRDLNKHI